MQSSSALANPIKNGLHVKDKVLRASISDKGAFQFCSSGYIDLQVNLRLGNFHINISQIRDIKS